MRDEFHLLCVAEAEVDRGAAAGGLRHDGLELSPVPDDLIETPLVHLARIAGCALDRSSPILGCSGILAAVFEQQRESASRVEAMLVCFVVLEVLQNLLVEFDE